MFVVTSIQIFVFFPFFNPSVGLIVSLSLVSIYVFINSSSFMVSKV